MAFPKHRNTNLGGKISSSKPSSSSRRISIRQIMIYILLSIFWFYTGSFLSSTLSHEKVESLEMKLQETLSNHQECQKVTLGQREKLERVKQSLVLNVKQMGEQKEEYLKQQQQQKDKEKETSVVNFLPNGGTITTTATNGNGNGNGDSSGSGSGSTTNDDRKKHRFGNGELFKGMAKTNKKDFLTLHDFGQPIDESQSSPNDVLLFYSHTSTPKDITEEEKINILNTLKSEGNSNSDAIQKIDASKSTNNCQILHVATIPSSEIHKQTCFAVIDNYNNQLTQKWMRKNNSLNEKLIPVTRGQNEKSRTFRAPDARNIDKHWKMLKTYFSTVEDVLDDLKPVAEKVAKDNTIIVMTCNMGQSELLMNFVCNAKSKGLGLDNVLVFPTDQETKDLAEGLGLTTFHDERNFGKLPSGEAKSYGDRTFIAMMFAKVVCVQLVNYLGYDLLFQDVDVVWYKNPLEYFHNTSNPHHDFDMYFQDDGARSNRYAPYSANSGFYYVRNNEKTTYLLTSLLYHGDMIVQSSSHQQALIQLLTNHASLFGLRVKVLSRDMEEFPGGWHYHRRNKDFMKKIVKDEITPYIFHMSWTKNKDNKVKFFKQMGQWYVDDKCISKTRDSILTVDPTSEENGENNAVSNHLIIEPCCLAEPNIVCHYRDKPSIIPCTESDPIDKGGRSFW